MSKGVDKGGGGGVGLGVKPQVFYEIIKQNKQFFPKI